MKDLVGLATFNSLQVLNQKCEKFQTQVIHHAKYVSASIPFVVAHVRSPRHIKGLTRRTQNDKDVRYARPVEVCGISELF
jgi:hypothetical protein